MRPSIFIHLTPPFHPEPSNALSASNADSHSSTSLLILLLLFSGFVVWVLDRKTPYVQVVADSDNDINLIDNVNICSESLPLDQGGGTYHKAPINSDRHAQHTE
jgi:hypothetical protein